MKNTEFQDTIEYGDRLRLKDKGILRIFQGYENCNHLSGCNGCKGYIIITTSKGYSTRGCFRTSKLGVLYIKAEIYKNLLSDEDFEL